MFKNLLLSLFLFKAISLSGQTGISQFADPAGNFSTNTSGICIGCSIMNASRVADNSLINYATIVMTAGVAATYGIRARLNALVPGGTYAGFYIHIGAAVAALPSVTVRTYKAGAFRETRISGGNLLVLLGGGSGFLCGIANATLDYDEVGISFNSGLASVALTANVYYAFGGYASCPMSVLPVMFTAMSVSDKNNKQVITWRAINDEKTFYEIQSSNDGINFTKIGSAESDDSHDEKDFHFVDPTLREANIYYRIKATEDNSNSVFFSNTIFVKARKAFQKAAINVFPNPLTGNKISILLNCKRNTAYTVHLLDARGIMVYKKTVYPLNDKIEVEAKADLVPGIYIVQVGADHSNQWITGKIIVQKN